MSEAAEHLIGKEDIAKVLSSTGPIVKCVLLRAIPKDGKDEHPRAVCLDGKSNVVTGKTATQNGEVKSGTDQNNGEKPELHLSRRKVLDHLMEEIEIDTTPSKNMVAKTLGGSFTFLGQYEDEGIVLMARKQPSTGEEMPTEEDLKTLKLSELRELCTERGISVEGMLEKAELMGAFLRDTELPPMNPHQLQPPLHKARVRGDILVLKVATTEDKFEQEGDEDNEAEEPAEDEFFLDYTKEDYIKFASRTDIEEYEIEDPSGVDGEEDNEEEEGAEEEAVFVLGEGEEIDEEDKSAMFNLVMNEVLRQYREDNGRGPNTQELLELRSAIAKQLDVEVAEIDAADADWDKKAKESSNKKRDRKIAFSSDTEVVEYIPDNDEHDHYDESDEREQKHPAKRLKADVDSEDEEEDSKPPAVERDNLRREDKGGTSTSLDEKESKSVECNEDSKCDGSSFDQEKDKS